MTGASNRLLVVENDLPTLNALHSLFERRGWTVTLARSLAAGQAALELRPDWIILGLGLPDGDGEEILRRIRQAGMAMGVVVTSSELDPERERALHELRPDLLVFKPINLVRIYCLCAGLGSVRSTTPPTARATPSHHRHSSGTHFASGVIE